VFFHPTDDEPPFLSLCEQAARSQGMTLPAWAAQTLDQATQASLQHANDARQNV
jgi:hypothetical protein